MIRVAGVDDDRMLLTGLAAWLAGTTDIRLVTAAGTVDALLRHNAHGIDVVLLDLLLANRSDPADNVRHIAARWAPHPGDQRHRGPEPDHRCLRRGLSHQGPRTRRTRRRSPRPRAATGRVPTELAFAYAHDPRASTGPDCRVRS
jgi:hypothetical protein